MGLLVRVGWRDREAEMCEFEAERFESMLTLTLATELSFIMGALFFRTIPLGDLMFTKAST